MTTLEDTIPDELVIPLRKSITLGETHHELRLQEPTAAQWAQFDQLTGVEADIKAISVVSGVPEPAIRLIGARDLIAGARYLARFLS